jgi:EmrB/QacA subfamily drug resistance transporter
LSRRQRLAVLLICSMSLLIVGLDTTIVNVALPAIKRSLHASVSGLQWTIDAYTLVLASLLMLAGSTADRVGRKLVFQIGLAAFSLGSLLCAVAPNLGLLIAFRIVQAIGGSMLNPVAMSIIRNVFEDPRERAQAVGVWAAMVGLSMALGPVVGGALVDSASWRWVFLVNVPIGLVAIALTFTFVPESKAPRARKIDPVGQLLVIVCLATVTYGIIGGHDAGWTSAQTLLLFAVAAAALAGLIGYELKRQEPLLELRFFRSAPFSGASVIAVCAFASLGGFLFLNTLYLQTVRHYSPLDAGLCMLPMAATTIVFGPVSGRLVGRVGSRPSLVCSGIGMLAAALMLTRITATTPLIYLEFAYLIFGIGFSLVNPPITNTAISGMPAAQAGVAAAIASTSRQVGMTLGVAAIGAVAQGAIGHGGLVAASRPAWWVLAALGASILALGAGTTTAWANGTAARAAGRLTPEAA